MNFTSYSYFVFLAIVVAVYFGVRPSLRWIPLLAASCYFYMAFIPAYILILAYLISVDFVLGIKIEAASGESRKNFLLLSLFSNLIVLGIFKYLNFINTNVTGFLSSVGIQVAQTDFHFILPLGISFHTFQSLSYIFEVYYGRQKAERHFGYYALYVMFFPQLVAGPIERPQNLLAQLKQEHRFDYERTLRGLYFIGWGLFQKLLIADKLAVFVDEAYRFPSHLGGLSLFVATGMFGIQIYCDFAGYSNMAIGSAQILGISLMKNFDAPYFSTSVTEFWRRWHISLSSWFRDYVYIPLGGNRNGRWKYCRNILLVFLVSGIWHGANWTFAAWGLAHGLFLILEKGTGTLFRGVLRPLKIIWTFFWVTLAWVFFRSANVAEAFDIVARIGDAFLHFPRQDFSQVFRQLYIPPAIALGLALAMAGLFIVEAFGRDRDIAGWLRLQPRLLRWSLYYVAVGLLIMFGNFGAHYFIYFQF